MASDEGNSVSEFTRNRVELVDRLKYAEDIAEQLQLSSYLAKTTVEKILHKQKTPTERKEVLLDAIERNCAYDIFAHCLRVSGQHGLYELMVDKVGVQPVTDELTTLQYRVYCKYSEGDPKEILVPSHIEQLLEKQRGVLQGMNNVESLVDLIEEEGCLTSEMTRAIKQQTGDIDKVKLHVVNMLVDHVKKTKLHSFLVLAMFLNITQQKNILKKISDESSRTALQRMDDLRLEVYYNQLGTIALQGIELETRLGMTAREFVTLIINSDSKAVNRKGLNEAHADRSTGKTIKLTDLFSDRENKEPPKTVLLKGAPGAGKTTAVTQLARDATMKKALSIRRPPFVILLRSIDWKNDTSLKKLLLNHGPELKEEEPHEVWEALSKHADDVTVILDGADEVPGGFFKREPGQVAGEESNALPQDILNNLISGKLLKGARVLVATRPFNLESCWDNFNRKVEVVGFNKKSLRRFLSNEVHEKIEEVHGFLATHVDIQSLLLTPLHAVTFVLHVKHTQHTDDWLIQSRTELSMSLIDTLVKTKLRKDHGGRIPGVNLEEQGDNLRKLCKLVATQLCSEGAIKTEMTRKDLKKQMTVADCVATGVFSVRVLVEVDVDESILIVPHQSILESLAALGLEQQQILKLVAVNDGRHDLVLIYVVGILAKKRNRKMLNYVLSEEDEEQEKARVVVRAVLGSKRRLLLGGEEFCQHIVVESQQWKLITDLMGVLETRWLTPRGSEQLMLADQLIQHDPLVRVEVDGISGVRYCPRATALELHDKVVTAADIAENAQHLRNLTSVSFYDARITRETVSELSKLNNVKAVSIERNEVGSASSDESSSSSDDNEVVSASSGKSSVLGGLSSISSLQYLSLSNCRLSSDDVVAVTSSCHRLLHLDLSYNDGVRGGDVRSRELTGLDVAACEMEGEELVEMAARNGETLTFLNADDNSLTSTHFNDILTHCPCLLELYTARDGGGGESVRALSERDAACRLNHLWLWCCDFSSLSSSGRQINASELSVVLNHHSSISSLALHRCYHLTPDVMSHLSSSMVAITKLFISPHREDPPPFPSDVASLVRASPRLNQLWLDAVHGKWQASDYMEVIDAINTSPDLRAVGLNVEKLTVDEVRDVVRALTRPLTRLWLKVGDRKREDYAEVVLEERELGVIQLVAGYAHNLYSTYSLYDTYQRESGSFRQHLPPSLPDNFRPVIW